MVIIYITEMQICFAVILSKQERNLEFVYVIDCFTLMGLKTNGGRYYTVQLFRVLLPGSLLDLLLSYISFVYGDRS